MNKNLFVAEEEEMGRKQEGLASINNIFVPDPRGKTQEKVTPNAEGRMMWDPGTPTKPTCLIQETHTRMHKPPPDLAREIHSSRKG